MSIILNASAHVYGNTAIKKKIQSMSTSIEQDKEHISLIASDSELESLANGSETIMSQLAEVKVGTTEIKQSVSEVSGVVSKTIKSISTEYYVSSSAIELQDGSWGKTYTWEDGKYIWQKSIIIYVDDTFETTSPVNVTGAKGAKGDSGEQGIAGKPGVDGKSSYFFIRYSANSNGSNMTSIPTSDTQYMGTTTTDVNVAPTSYIEYTWTKIKGSDGEKGDTGNQGEVGADGKSSYLHVKYSNDGSTFTSDNGETLGEWIGTYVDFIEEDSTVFSDYTWKKFVGENGTDGRGIVSTTVTYKVGTSGTEKPIGDWSNSVQSAAAGEYLWTKTVITYTSGDPTTSYSVGKMGETGAKGTSSYTFIRYSTNSNGNPMVDTPTDSTLYIGIAITTTSTAPSTYTGYKWSRYTGKDGVDGKDGTNGVNGTSVSLVTGVYLRTTSSTTVPSKTDSGWSQTVPKIDDENQYIWTMQVVTLVDANGVTTESRTVPAVDKNATSTYGYIKTNADKISMVVSSESSTGKLVLTDSALDVITNDINLNGKVTFSGLNSSAQQKITSAETTANEAKSYAKPAVEWTSTNGDNQTKLFSMVNKWTDNAVSDTTQINGGWIKTNTITAEHLAIGDFNNLATVNELNPNTALPTSYYGGSVISDGYIYKGDASNSYLMFSNHKKHNLKKNDKLYYSISLTSANSTVVRPHIWFYDINKTYVGCCYGEYSTITSTEKTINGIIDINFDISYCPYYIYGLYDESTTRVQIYARQVTCYKQTNAVLIEDGSITANKISVNDLSALNATIGGFTLSSTDMSYGTWGNTGGMLISPSGTTVSKSIGGSNSINGWALTLGSTFGVTNGGNMYSTSGKIGGWEISDTSLYYKKNNGEVYLGQYTVNDITYTGLQLMGDRDENGNRGFVNILPDSVSISSPSSYAQQCFIDGGNITCNYIDETSYGTTQMYKYFEVRDASNTEDALNISTLASGGLRISYYDSKNDTNTSKSVILTPDMFFMTEGTGANFSYLPNSGLSLYGGINCTGNINSKNGTVTTSGLLPYSSGSNIGSFANKWENIYTNSLNTSTITASGNLDVGGNSSFTGTITMSGNIIPKTTGYWSIGTVNNKFSLGYINNMFVSSINNATIANDGLATASSYGVTKNTRLLCSYRGAEMIITNWTDAAVAPIFATQLFINTTAYSKYNNYCLKLLKTGYYRVKWRIMEVERASFARCVYLSVRTGTTTTYSSHINVLASLGERGGRRAQTYESIEDEEVFYVNANQYISCWVTDESGTAKIACGYMNIVVEYLGTNS